MRIFTPEDVRVAKLILTADPHTQVAVFGIGHTDPRNLPELYVIGTISLKSAFVSFFDAEDEARQLTAAFAERLFRSAAHGRQGPII